MLRIPPADDPFLKQLGTTIREKRLIRPGQSVLVAFSAGADSTALLLALLSLTPELGISVAAAHVNHMLRGAEADADAAWARGACHALGVRLHMACADVERMRAARGGSVEERARWARFRLLEDVRRQCGADLLVTAHHLDDQAETVLMHLLRGSGTTGLAGMSWGPEGGTIRPFLGTRRQEIREALDRWGAEWRTDSSNASLDLARNRLRLDLLPALEREWNPKIAASLARTADVVRADEDALEEWTDRTWSEAVILACNQRVLLDRHRASAYPLGIRRRLTRRAASFLRTVSEPLSHAETSRLVRLLDERGRVTLRGKLRAWTGRSGTCIEAVDSWRGPTAVGADRTCIQGWGTLVVSDREPQGEPCFGIPEGWLAEGLVVRRWKPGDRIMTGGLHKPITVADLARESGRPIDPESTIIVARGETPVWAVGLAAARVDEGGRRVWLTWQAYPDDADTHDNVVGNR